LSGGSRGASPNSSTAYSKGASGGSTIHFSQFALTK
jgi:sphingolipid 4-desaturase/C4-monooxygenase